MILTVELEYDMPDAEGLQPAFDGDVTVKLVVGDVEAPLAELTPYDLAPPSKGSPLQLEPSVLAAIGNLLRTAPSAVGLGIQLSSKSYILQFSPNVAMQLKSGTATLMQALNGGVRAVAVDANGRIVGTGKLVAVGGLSSAATAIMFWQTLALVTAQHYLHDMQEQLREISATVKDVQDFLMAKEVAVLVSHERFLQRTMQSVKQGAASELDMAAISSQLEQMERECDQVQELMRHLMERQAPRLKDAPLTAWFPWEVTNNVKAAEPFIDEFDRAMKVFAATVRIKAMIAAVRAQVFRQTQISLARLKEARDDGYRGHKIMLSFYELISVRGREVWANTDVIGLLNGLRQDLAQRFLTRLQDARNQFEGLDAQLEIVQRHMNEVHTNIPPALLIHLDPDGHIHAYAAPKAAVSQQVR